MKKFLICIFSLISFVLNAQLQSKLPSLIKKVDQSIIKIYTLDSKNKYESQGSGVIISNNGICISNYHVLAGAKKAVAIMADGKKYLITTIVDYSKQNDLIKFKIDIGSQFTKPAILNNNLPQKGVEVFAVGYPNGFEMGGGSTISTGIISGIREEKNKKLIQTSTPFTHGSSGGGLFDDVGRLIGITSGTFATDIKDRHANLNKVIPTLLISELSRNMNLNMLKFYELIKNDENLVKGMLAYEKHDYRTAIDFFTKHINEFPQDATTWFRLGNSYNQLGRGSLNMEFLNRAIDCFDISISIDSTIYYSWGQAALIFSVTNEISLAKYYAYKAFSLAPFESFTNYVFGKVANEARDYSLAVEFLGNAIKMADEYDKLNFCHQWYLERAISYSILDLDSQAENDYKACLNLNLNNQDCYAEYGIFLANRGRKDEACKNFRILYNKNPNYLRGQKESIKELMFPYCN